MWGFWAFMKKVLTVPWAAMMMFLWGRAAMVWLTAGAGEAGGSEGNRGVERLHPLA
jgi:hypothetical protein